MKSNDSSGREINASESGKLNLDPAGFFVVHADLRSQNIFVEHYAYDRKIQNKFKGKTAKSLCDTIIKRELTLDASHASYLGRELMKAEISLRKGLVYTQDKPLKL